MTTHGSVAKKVREHKALHPELYCRNARCLHRTPCPRHESELMPATLFDTPEATLYEDGVLRIQLSDRPTPYTPPRSGTAAEHR